MSFSHVTTWIFDLDNTLYDPAANLFSQVERLMIGYVMRELRVDQAEANRLRHAYWRDYGTTLAGLTALHGVDPLHFLAEVHDIDFTVLTPDPELNDAIAALPGQKIIHTNGDSDYAQKVLTSRGLAGFSAIYGVEKTDFHPKPDPRAYAAVLRAHGHDPRHAAMIEDDPRNLNVPAALGMATVLVGSGRSGPDDLDPGHIHGPHVQHQTSDLTAFLRALV